MASDEELDEEARRRVTLDQEIARKYDAERLKKLVKSGAGRGEKLDLATRSYMERLLPGYDFNKVRVFRGDFAEEMTKKHRADALTVANTGMILMRQSPRSAQGTTAHQALLAHELTHVAQAQRGMHFALEGGGGGNGPLEAEAEQVESEVAGGVASPNFEDDGRRQGGAENEKSKREHRRRMVLERALEMLWDKRRFMYERLGRGHGF
jgi:hypothetical protein